jgi:hypothetical protein
MATSNQQQPAALRCAHSIPSPQSLPPLRPCLPANRSKGARVINTSFVIGSKNQPLMDAIQQGTAAGVFFSG